jgi:hypothetical protein
MNSWPVTLDDMTNNSSYLANHHPSALSLWSAIRVWVQTRIQESAERRQLRRELAPYRNVLATVGAGENAASWEFRDVLLADVKRSA